MTPASVNGTLPGLGVLEQTPIIIEKLVHLASPDQLRWKPSQQRWSISEILAHLVHVEGESFRDRIELMIKQKKSAHSGIRSGRRLCGRKIFRRRASRASESFLPRARPHLVLPAVYVAQRLTEDWGTRHTRNHHRGGTDERVGIPRLGAHPADRGIIPLPRVFPSDGAAADWICDSALTHSASRQPENFSGVPRRASGFLKLSPKLQDVHRMHGHFP